MWERSKSIRNSVYASGASQSYLAALRGCGSMFLVRLDSVPVVCIDSLWPCFGSGQTCVTQALVSPDCDFLRVYEDRIDAL